MNKGKIASIIFFACSLAAFIAFNVSKYNEREKARRSVELQRSQAHQKYVEAQNKREREARKQREEEENADNAKYQVERWENIYNKYLNDEACFSFKMSTSQKKQLRRDQREAWKKLVYWSNKRQDEIVQECGSIERAKQNEEYKKLSRLLNDLDRKRPYLFDD